MGGSSRLEKLLRLLECERFTPLLFKHLFLGQLSIIADVLWPVASCMHTFTHIVLYTHVHSPIRRRHK